MSAAPDRDLVERAFGAFFDGDLDGTVAMMAPDVVGYDAPEMPDASTHHGRDAVKQRLAGFRELFHDLEMGPIRIEELGERMLVVIDVKGQAVTGDMPVEFSLSYVLTFEDGLATELRSFLDEGAARAAL